MAQQSCPQLFPLNMITVSFYHVVSSWRGQPNNAPFDQNFYLILNVAVGGTNGYFPDGEVAQVSRGQDSVRVSMLLIPEIETDTLFLQEIHLLAAHLERSLRIPVAIVNVVDGFSGRRQTVLTDVLSPEHRFPPASPSPVQSAPPPQPPGQPSLPEV